MKIERIIVPLSKNRRKDAASLGPDDLKSAFSKFHPDERLRDNIRSKYTSRSVTKRRPAVRVRRAHIGHAKGKLSLDVEYAVFVLSRHESPIIQSPLGRFETGSKKY